MENFNELEARIKTVNSSIAKLNNERNSNLARKKVYEEEFNKGCAEYNAKYGTAIDLSNITEEYTRVQEHFSTKVAEMEQVIRLVKEGRVSEAEAILKGVPEVAAQMPATEPVEPAAESVQGAQPVQEAQPVVQPMQEAQQVVQEPQMANTQPTVGVPVQPTLSKGTQTVTETNPVVPPVGQPQAQGTVPVQPVAPAPQSQGTADAIGAPTPVFAEDDIMPKPTSPLFRTPVQPTAPKSQGTVPHTMPVPPTAPTAQGTVPSQPVVPTPQSVKVESVGTETSDVGAFDQLLRQEQQSASPIGVPRVPTAPTAPTGSPIPTAPTGAVPTPPVRTAPKPPVGAVPTPPPFPASLQGSADDAASVALNFGDILSGTDFI